MGKPRNMSVELETGRKTARREFSTSLMSNAKWRAFFSALHAVDPPILQLAVKLTGNEQEELTRLPQLYPPHPFVSFVELGGPIPLIELEWVEVPNIAVFARFNSLPSERLEQDNDAVRSAVERTGKLYRMEQTATGLRVIGHLR